MGRGRPTKLNAYTLGIISSQLKLGMSRARAATAAGIDERTLRYWQHRGRVSRNGLYRLLRDEVEAAEAQARRPDPCYPPYHPEPVMIREATVKAIDGFVREPVNLDVESLKQLLDVTFQDRSAGGFDVTTEPAWISTRLPRKDIRIDPKWMELFERKLRVSMLDKRGTIGILEFELCAVRHSIN